MLPAERRNFILDVLQRTGKIEIETVAAELKVSSMTIRRDLALLEEQGMAHRTHGGAVLHDGLLREVPYKSKEISKIEEKRRIGKEASRLIKNGDIIILDAGTTTLEVARSIGEIENLTVITNDLKIALELSETSKATVFCLGGQVQKGLGTTFGSTAYDFLSHVRVDRCFLATSSIDLEYGLSNPTLEKAKLKRKMIQVADQVILVADHSKFHKKSFALVAGIEEIDLIITDQGLEASIEEELKQKGVDIRLV